jgi:hypothetical protein
VVVKETQITFKEKSYRIRNFSFPIFLYLWIEDKWDWSRKHPVIRISFTSIGFVESGLAVAMNDMLDWNKIKRPIVIVGFNDY